MKRFLIPFTIAVLIHVFLLRLQGDWGQKRLFQAQPAPIALALNYVQPKAAPLPSLPRPQKKVEEKQEPVIPETKKNALTPEQPKRVAPEPPPTPKPEVKERKPSKIPKLRKEIAKKETPVPTQRPEPSPQPPLKEKTPPSTPPSPLPSAPETQTEASVPAPASPQQTLADPSLPHRNSNPDGERKLASLKPEKGLKEAVPIYRQNPPPNYPRIARRRGFEGTVVLEVLVSREGRVSDLRVFKSCGHSVLDEAAADSVKSWLFDPGKMENEPVEMWVRVPIRFQLKE